MRKLKSVEYASVRNFLLSLNKLWINEFFITREFIILEIFQIPKNRTFFRNQISLHKYERYVLIQHFELLYES